VVVVGPIPLVVVKNDPKVVDFGGGWREVKRD